MKKSEYAKLTADLCCCQVVLCITKTGNQASVHSSAAENGKRLAFADNLVFHKRALLSSA